MKTILISGCSYGLIFSHHLLKPCFDDNFGAKNIINISKTGASFDTQIKNILETLSVGDRPDLILIPITHMTRYDEPVGKNFDPTLVHDRPLCVSMDPFQNEKDLNARFESKFNLDFINSLLKTKTMLYDDATSFNNLLVKIITLSAFLKKNGYRYVIFDMCNNLKNYKNADLNKIKFIENDINVMNLFDFCGNEYMHQFSTGIPEDQKYFHHYKEHENIQLLNYINSYIIKNNI